jgi:diacylglycerol kinase (ATP)
MKKAKLIYNPTSGREDIKNKLADILNRLDCGGIEASCHATSGEGDAAAIAAAEQDYDLIIAAGGDGTLNEVVNGIAGKEHRPSLGIFPCGTTNDFATSLGIPKSWEAFVDLVIRQETRTIDIGQANERFFINIAGGGILTEVTYEVPSKLKTMVGPLAYYMKGIEKITAHAPQELMIRANNQPFIHDEFMLFLITNSTSVGGFRRLAPGALIDDGLFDFVAVKKCTIAEMLRLVTLTFKGEHLDDKRLLHFRTDYLEVSSPKCVQLNLDGERGGILPGTFRVLPGHIRIFSSSS